MMSNTSDGSITTSALLSWKYLDVDIRNFILDYCDGLSLYNFISSLYWHATIRYKYIDKNTTNNDIINGNTTYYYISPKDPYIGYLVKSMVSIGQDRMESALQKIESSSNHNGNYASDALLWLRTTTSSLLTEIDNCLLSDETIWNQCTDKNGSLPILQSCTETIIIDHSKSILFKNTLYHYFMILDYLETCIRDYTIQFYLHTRNVIVDLHEWPIWCGVITVEVDIVDETTSTTTTTTTSTTEKKLYTASVVITSPISDRLHPTNILLPGCNKDLSKSTTYSLAKPTQTFKCEANNSISIEQPWASIRGLTVYDNFILENHIGQYLNTTNQIGVPIQLNPDLNIRLMTKHSARVQRQQNRQAVQQHETRQQRRREQQQLPQEQQQEQQLLLRLQGRAGRIRLEALRQQRRVRDRLQRQQELQEPDELEELAALEELDEFIEQHERQLQGLQDLQELQELHPAWIPTEWILHEPNIVPGSITPLLLTNYNNNDEEEEIINHENLNTIESIIEESTTFHTQLSQCTSFPLICTWDNVDETTSRNSKIHFSESDSMEYLVNVQKMAQDCSKFEV